VRGLRFSCILGPCRASRTLARKAPSPPRVLSATVAAAMGARCAQLALGDALVSRSRPPGTSDRLDGRPRAFAIMRMPMQAKLPAFGGELAVRPASFESAVAAADVARARELEGPQASLRMRASVTVADSESEVHSGCQLDCGAVTARLSPGLACRRKLPKGAPAVNSPLPTRVGRCFGSITRTSVWHPPAFEHVCPLLTLMFHTTHHPGIRSAYATLFSTARS
jgi:hypothetical protein